MTDYTHSLNTIRAVDAHLRMQASELRDAFDRDVRHIRSAIDQLLDRRLELMADG